MERWSSALNFLNVAFVATIGFSAASIPFDYIDSTERFAEKPIDPKISQSNFITLTGDEVEGIATAQFVDRYRKTPLNIVDLRASDKYSEGHIAGSVNIPEDDLPRLAPKAFAKDEEIFIFCNYNPLCESGDAGRGVLSRCKRVAQKFKFHYGYKNAVLVRANIKELSSAGVIVTGGSRPGLVSAGPDGSTAR